LLRFVVTSRHAADLVLSLAKIYIPLLGLFNTSWSVERTYFAYIRTLQLLLSILQKEIETRRPSQVPSINRC
jgi:hypothetical protein